MVVKKKTKPNKRIIAEAKRVLEFAKQRAGDVSDWMQLHNALFGLAGKATEAFSTESERTAFSQTRAI